MKKKIWLVSIISIILFILAIVFYFYFKNYYIYNEKYNLFNIPKNTEYAIVYSTSQGSKEKSFINYFDVNGTFISKNEFNSVLNSECINKNPNSNTYQLFTLETIYKSNSSSNIQNFDLQELYKFASEDGNDFVYETGYLENIGMFYKYIPHGMAYDIEELGNFDLLIFYNEHKVYNIRINESGSIAADHKNSSIYNLTGDSGDYIRVEKIDFHNEKDEFEVVETNLDLSEFFLQTKIDNESYYLGKAVVSDEKIYVFIHVDAEKNYTYLLQCNINKNDNTITYENSYKIDLKDNESMPFNITAVAYNQNIKYYSYFCPSEIITFDKEKKEFSYSPLIQDYDINDDTLSQIRYINNRVYVLAKDIDHMTFEIYLINADNSSKLLVKGELPKIHSTSDMWVTDFYVFHEN
ncbi:MAG: hypothetical protein IJ711_11230 [Lachnospiraceae bacterium]|nr:hypothetical protein [Lachnospiraceae bacterium]